MKIPYKDLETRAVFKAIGFGILGIIGLYGAANNACTAGQFNVLRTFDEKGYDPEEILGKDETEEDS